MLPLQHLIFPEGQRFLRDQDDLPSITLLDLFDHLTVLRLYPADQIGVGPDPDSGDPLPKQTPLRPAEHLEGDRGGRTDEAQTSAGGAGGAPGPVASPAAP